MQRTRRNRSADAHEKSVTLNPGPSQERPLVLTGAKSAGIRAEKAHCTKRAPNGTASTPA